jgi:putative peptide zinc metalloprotease protein
MNAGHGSARMPACARFSTVFKASAPKKVDGTETAPDRPAVAPGTELAGPQQDASFDQRQWLVQRDGRFLQVSELLYRLLQQLDGRRDRVEIAARLTDVTPWTVTPDDVAELLRSKLMPAGLIAAADGREASAGARRSPAPRTPLAVAMRVRTIGPRFLEPVTGVLRKLFAPPVLVPALALIAVAHAWAYLGDGVGHALRDVLLRPLLVPAVFGIVLLTAAWHELGHASALRYGGGKPRGIGVGLYLVYPVFYTDTTDAYRLGRWSRVRVDLGGFYFHLLAAVGLIGLADLTGETWLLAAVLVINLEVLRQLLFPFVRLDGYWLLADLTGVPDLFSQVGPFLRSRLRLAGSNGERLPELRPWARRVFVGYLAVAIPLLAFLAFQAISRLPGFVKIAWQSFDAYREVLRQAVQGGDILGAMTASVQLLVLAAPAIGTLTFAALLMSWMARAIGRRIAPRAPA